MAQHDPRLRNGQRGDIRKNRGLTSRYLDRTRAQRLSRMPRSALGWRFFLLFGVVLIGAGLIVLTAGVGSVFATYTTDLPPVNELSKEFSFKTTQILDRNGTLLYQIDDQNGGRRFPVHLGDVSQNLIDATVATEDKDFYSNSGIDPIGIARAVWQNMVQGQLVQGASTITQQLAKNVLIDRSERDQKSYIRKMQEAALAFKISQQYSKDQVLEMYLNQVYYGHLSYGIEAAARTYFGKSAKDLDVAEASLLAGLPQAPSQYDPVINLEAAKKRQSHVLDRMVQQNYITQEQADWARQEVLKLQTGAKEPFEAPHFVMYVRQLLEQKYGANVVYRLGLKVTTTLDLRMNRIAENAINAHMENLRIQNANNAGLVALNPRTGEIMAMVGSRDYYDNSIAGEVNMATSPRPPGSTIKPIEYVTAFMRGWGPETIITDEPTRFPNTQSYLPDYTPHNFDFKFDGPMTIRYALSNSKNIPAIKSLMFATIPEFLKVAEGFGIHLDKPEVYGLSLGLGAASVSLLNMVGAYAAIDNYGSYHPPVAILKVEDWQGNVMEQFQPTRGRQVVSPVQAYMITSILSDNWARTPLQGPNSALLLSRPDAAKTGSTDDYKDSWTIGYTPDLAAGVWVGNTDNKPMKEVLGSMGAGRIWHSFMEDVHLGAPVEEFVPPPGIREYKVCLETGQAPTSDCDNVLTEVWPETYTPAEYAIVPGLPAPNMSLRGDSVKAGKILGQTVTQAGQNLQPIPTLMPGEKRPTPMPGPTTGPIVSATATPDTTSVQAAAGLEQTTPNPSPAPAQPGTNPTQPSAQPTDGPAPNPAQPAAPPPRSP